MSFSDLQRARQQRLKPSPSRPAHGSPGWSDEPQQASSAVDVQSSGALSPTQDVKLNEANLVKINPGMFKDLPPNVEIRADKNVGRGLYVSRNAAIGSVLFSAAPHVHSISTNYLSACCTYCSNESDPSKLKRCSDCKVIWYDSAFCQKNDWKLHKEECQAIRRWRASANDSADEERLDSLPLPNDAVRGLARLLWLMGKAGLLSAWSQEVFQMQSNRTKFSPTSPAHKTLTNFGHALAVYLGTDEEEAFGSSGTLRRFGIDSPRDFVDILSKFTTNSVTLTTPTLSPIGVFVSPLIALINHSCRPNAVIVFPTESRSNAVKKAEVIALRPIAPGEQILASYIDISQPTPVRLRELKEGYLFDCTCEACVGYLSDSSPPDPRESLHCSRCNTLTGFAYGSESRLLKGVVSCGACGTSLVVDSTKFYDALDVSHEALQKARRFEFSDPPKAIRYTASSQAALAPYPLHKSSHPLLELSRLHVALLIHELASLPEPKSLKEQASRDTKVDETCRAAACVVSGVCDDRVFALGHPVRGVALAELGKLLCVDVSPDMPPSSSWSRIPRGIDRIHLAVQVLTRARKELEIGCGKEGGDVGNAIWKMLVDLGREVGAWRRVERSDAFQARVNAGGGTMVE
ncbi:uncharacterized protein EI90DRAFT_2919583 [Cantharellus anzutake]|uniref:uncharacterized protein n=1 Tax=Cantharellus anzutake TaxID=1750568 RepID=UPI00190615FD|nr:uncharacterized protein EI90DRAFT_2919583 [Cantharellus anzutake]KAF8331774.1 hypothetical protein EI90DRAFT_2919583 [Cantharellus anzutake]